MGLGPCCSSCLGHLWRRAAESGGDDSSVGSFGLPRASSGRGSHHGTGGGSSSSRRAWAEVPEGCGLTLKLDPEGICRMGFTPDTGVPFHPNIRVPIALRGLRELGGGGSGVTVVAGYDPSLGKIVFKHGGERDTAEFFALGTIEEQLRQRGRANDAAEAAKYMWDRTPDFKFLYVSRVHLKNRGAQLWGEFKFKLKRQIAKRRGTNISQVMRSSVMMRLGSRGVETPVQSSPESEATPTPPGKVDKPIRLCRQASGGDESEVVSFVDGRLQIVLETQEDVWTDLMAQEEVRCCRPGGDFSYLQRFCKQLVELQRQHQWKFTLAQKAIGGQSPVTCCKLLVRDQLRGELLRKLVGEYLVVIEHLRKLTFPQERSFHAEAQEEFDRVRTGAQEVLSPACDTYLGLAVNKNFDPARGRFRKLRDIGQAFRSGQLGGKALVLMDGEAVPAQLLGRILDRGARMEDTFAGGVHGPTALDTHGDSWLGLLEEVLRLQGPAARERVWTCGVSDGGLHNLFLEATGLWLFDMGEPALMSLPGFLTKFLFSFFHTLGMEEPAPDTESKKLGRQVSPGAGSEWVNRFSYDEGPKVELTSATAGLLASAEAALQETLRSLVAEVFDGEQEVVGVLIRYIILQLLSDASFCLEKWQIKGGGAARGGDRGGSLEKWLWRALWDVFAASYVACRGWPERPAGGGAAAAAARAGAAAAK